MVSRNGLIAGLYLKSLGQVCRSLPDGHWKQFVANSIHTVNWPEMNLGRVNSRFPGGELEVTLVPHIAEFDFQALINRRLTYEEEVFRWLSTRSYLTVVEIGANVGWFSLYFAKRFSSASVYAFEPSRKAFSRLLTNVAANDPSNLCVFNCAIFSEAAFGVRAWSSSCHRRKLLRCCSMTSRSNPLRSAGRSWRECHSRVNAS